MSLFRRFGRGKKDEASPEDPVGAAPAVPAGIFRKKNLVTVDLDTFSPESHKELMDEIVRRSGIPLFESSVTHGYSKSFASGTETCPRCQSPTRQHTVNFIYTTDAASRVMLAPAGFFCQACPTVIVDEKLVSMGMKAGYRFRRVVGIDYFGKKDPDYFGTWNGEKPLYILDENEQIMDMVVDSEMRQPASGSSRSSRTAAKKTRSKPKQAAKARRRNKKKKR